MEENDLSEEHFRIMDSNEIVLTFDDNNVMGMNKVVTMSIRVLQLVPYKL